MPFLQIRAIQRIGLRQFQQVPKVEGIVNKLKAMGISVKYDNADNKRPGFKFADYELKGVPVRLVLISATA